MEGTRFHGKLFMRLTEIFLGILSNAAAVLASFQAATRPGGPNLYLHSGHHDT
jgi:hypothetical protein